METKLSEEINKHCGFEQDKQYSLDELRVIRSKADRIFNYCRELKNKCNNQMRFGPLEVEA